MISDMSSVMFCGATRGPIPQQPTQGLKMSENDVRLDLSSGVVPTVSWEQMLVNHLNDLLAHDSQAITLLVEQRVECGKALGTHPRASVMMVRDEAGQTMYQLGLVGIFNGLLATYGRSRVSYEVNEEDGLISRFFLLEPVKG